MVNVRDLGGIKHTFKLLVYPDPRLFQCANADAKKVRMIYQNSEMHLSFWLWSDSEMDNAYYIFSKYIFIGH